MATKTGLREKQGSRHNFCGNKLFKNVKTRSKINKNNPKNTLS